MLNQVDGHHPNQPLRKSLNPSLSHQNTLPAKYNALSLKNDTVNLIYHNHLFNSYHLSFDSMLPHHPVQNISLFFIMVF